MPAALNRSARSTSDPIRVLAFIEAAYVTGPAKPLIEFGKSMKTPPAEWGVPAVDLSIATYCRGGQTSNVFTEAVRAAELPIHILEERYRYDLDARRQMRALIAEISPDLIETHGVKSHFLLKSVGWGNRPWIAFHHGYTTPNFKMRVYNQLDRWSLRSADRVITVCIPFARDLEARGVERERIEVLHNFETPSRAPEAAILRGLREEFRLGDSPVILAIGRMSQEKGLGDLITALAFLRKTRPGLDWVALLVGTGQEQGNIERAVTAAELTERVRFAGQQVEPMRFFHVANLLALPSWSEGSPLVVLEAMATGLPIAGTAVGGVPEIVRNRESALLTAPREPEELARSIATLLEDPALAGRLRDKGLEDLAQKFSPEFYMRRLTGIFTDLLG